MVATKILPNALLAQKPIQATSDSYYAPTPTSKTDFSYVKGTETHTVRRQMILKKYPQIIELMKPTSNSSLYITVFLVIAQLTLAYFLRNASWPVFLLVGYWVGGTIAHTSHVLVHDLTHLVGHPDPTVNRIFAILANLCVGIPSAISFGKYHADHHNFMGEYGQDPDIPFVVQAKNVNTTWKKALFLLAIPFVYALRPVFFLPRKTQFWEYVNFIVVVTFDLLVLRYLGLGGLGYFLFCAYLSIGPHPSAWHVLAEHFEVAQGVETYDYMGIWNYPGLNIGYHTEHHDFPNIPWYNLPKVRQIAKEFYEIIPAHTSYVKLAYKFVFDRNFGLFNRTLRENPKNTN